MANKIATEEQVAAWEKLYVTPDEAKRLLQIHSGRDAETDPHKWESGFLVPLRASPDSLNEANFLEVMECIKVLAPEIAASKTVDRELMAALWGIIYYPRLWAFNPVQLEGLIRNRCKKLNGKELSRLADWLDRIAEAVQYALDGAPNSVGDAMIEYGQPLPDYFKAVGKHAETGGSGRRRTSR